MRFIRAKDLAGNDLIVSERDILYLVLAGPVWDCHLREPHGSWVTVEPAEAERLVSGR